MTVRIRNRADFESGLFFAIFGGATAILSQNYRIGTAASMGPGYFPTVLGALLFCLGIGFILKGLSFRDGSQRAVAAPAVPWKPAAIVILSLLAFAISLNRLGMVVAIPLIVTISLFAASDFRLVRALVLSLILLGASYLVFYVGLGVPMKIHPWS